MNLQQSMQQVAVIKEKIQQKLTHSYLQQFIVDPVIDEDRILFFLSSIQDGELGTDEVEKYVTTAMLVQIALDTHERINNHEEDRLKERQLTVLAGDYFSGLYYKLLADLENVTLVRTLAQGIKLVNEHKIAIYEKESQNIEAFMASLKKVEISIFEKFCTYFNENEKVIARLGEQFLFLKRLVEEKEQFIQKGTSVLFEGLKKFSFAKVELNQELSPDQNRMLLRICEKYIEHTKELIDQLVHKFPVPNEFLLERINQITNRRSAISKLYAEEG
ncbi:heptaprenyl diphosphate synthase component 1 [Falsibacillus pallidus]|uniref:Heptaprenyl diphosphate synthase n=1 Tax=Falsibacillus pallidus TaxID=493781 RepID=A0A370GGR8_9BACI|nr:heptaprenyl diphosphate synthase component 1 [Falsibacillus pallidus]RDI42988.1 heptaprenyl diphosphate synthase [Falsibacillus pallidus]